MADSTPTTPTSSAPETVPSAPTAAPGGIDHPQPLQIIKTEDANEDYFILQEENLNHVVSKIPPDMKVAVIAVVGAFRSGKSFLLNFFLRYLRNGNAEDFSQDWMLAEGEVLREGNMNEGDWSLVESEKREASFAWRGGEERQTTGIWMWSEPFIRTTSSSNGEKIAILLMDTQGMFDNETTMTLTAQIFGLSTLVSSFQIYNVDKRVQEDNLQHLALFSEYGRMALSPEMDQESKKQELLAKTSTPPVLPTPSAESASESTASAATPETEKKDESAPEVPKKHVKKPFQRLQFLVRDWQNFDKDYADEEDSPALFNEFLQAMQKYVNEVLRDRNLADLQSTREQIVRCFEKVDCFQLPHPGSAVTRKNYDGTIKKIDPNFRGLVNRYVRYIFDDQLEPKEVNHRQITGRELKAYFEVYAKMFQTGEKTFPKAMTMLDATAEANNRNAYDMALAHYKKHMDLSVGEGKSFVKESELTTLSDHDYKIALEIFDEIATMGSPSAIQKCRNTLVENLDNEKKRYFTTNALRNPFKDAELYVIPIAVAIAAWFLAVFTDKTCSTDFCERVEDTFVNVYLFVFFGLLVFAWKQVRGTAMYLKELAPLVVNHLNKAKN